MLNEPAMQLTLGSYEQLAEMPEGTVFIDKVGDVGRLVSANVIETFGTALECVPECFILPVRTLYIPGDDNA